MHLPVRFLVGFGVAGDAAEGQHVLGLLLPQDVHRVVVGDDADEHVRCVDDGDRDQVVLVNLAGNGLLVFVTRAWITSCCMMSSITAARRARISFLRETNPISRRL